MGRWATSPVKRWPGRVRLAEPLSYPQVFAVEDALQAARELNGASQARLNFAILPGILACVEEWELEGLGRPVTLETFPATPVRASAELVGWLVEEVVKAYRGEEVIPNG